MHVIILHYYLRLHTTNRYVHTYNIYYRIFFSPFYLLESPVFSSFDYLFIIDDHDGKTDIALACLLAGYD